MRWTQCCGPLFYFGKNGQPGAVPVKENYFSREYKPVLQELKLLGGQSFYSWKHTGVCKLYMKFKGPKMIMEQCRHSGLDITMHYLRDLGLFDAGEMEKGFPEI